MKRPLYVYTLEILLFFVLLAGSFLLLAPVSKKLDSGIAEARNIVLGRMEKATGLKFSYSSMSPSILRSLRIKDLVVRDAENGSVIANISEVSITYSIRDILAGNVSRSIREIVIRNGTVSIDTGTNSAAIEQITKLAAKGSDSSFPGTAKDAVPETENTSVRVRISNVSVSFHDRQTTVSGSVSKGFATLNGDEILFSINGFARFDHPAISFSQSTSAGIELNGSVSRSFGAGTASLMLRSLESGKFSVSKLGLVTSFRDGVVSVNTVGSLEPVDVNVVWNIARKSLKGSFECESLLPLKWIRIRSDANSMLTRLENTVLTGSATVTLEDGKGLEYSADLSASVPDVWYGGGNAVLRCSGDLARLDLAECSFSGPIHEISGSLSVDLERMIPEGIVSARKIELRSGCTLSGEMYVQPEGAGFVCVLPELSVNENVLSSVEIACTPAADTVGFTLSAYDSSGHIGCEGSFSGGKEKFLQLYAAFDSISVPDTVETVSALVAPGKDMSGITEKLGSFALTTEVYVSTDFSDVSFNCTRLVLASEKKDGIYILLSAKGNRNGVDLTDISVSKGGYDVSGNINTAFENSGNIIFNTNFVVNTIPYTASGTYDSGILSIYGDYGLAFSASLGDGGRLSGNCATKGMPVPVGPALVSLSLDAGFDFASASDWNVAFHEGTVEEMGNLLPLPTMLSFIGSANPGGVVLRSLSLSDQLSLLNGHASLTALPDATWRAEISLASTETNESLAVNGSLFLSDGLRFQTDMELVDVPLMRFFRGQQSSSRATLSLSASGTPNDPVVSARVGSIVWRFGEFDLEGNGMISVGNGIARASDVNASWNGHTFSALDATLPLDSFKARIETDYQAVLGKSSLTAKLALDLTPETDLAASDSASGTKISGVLERFSLGVTVSDARWKTFALDKPFTSVFIHEPGVTAVYAGENDAITGFLLDDGTFSLQSGATLPVSFHADGEVKSSAISIQVADFNTDLAVLWPFFDRPQVDFREGKLEGNFVISGILNDPEFRGTIHGNRIVVEAPGLLGETYGPVSFDVNAEGKTLTIPEFAVSGKDGSFTVAGEIGFDRWIPSSVNIRTRTLPGRMVRVSADNQYLKASGFASFDLVVSVVPDLVGIDGSASFERGSFAILFSGFTGSGRSSGGQGISIRSNLAINIGKKVEFRWPTDDIPIIRGLVQADKPLEIALDTSSHTFGMKGTANLKGGEIFYIKRNFYLRNGNITFNENQDVFDPLVSVRAEIRERDEEGEPVRIILLVDNQPLSTFTPVLYSDPPKTDLELMSLLGQATSADASRETLLKDTVVSATDILTQISLFRNAENGIRDLLGLDIFSIRTLILQNAILGPSMQTATDKAMTIGNYFDNTTVYMGKYLGSAIYADALMHFSYYDPLLAENPGERQAVYQNLLFQPELGLEVSTPFFLLRWGITPAHPDTLFVADNSITLSWKFSY